MSNYTVQIINRGEEVLYRDGDRWLEASVTWQAGRCLLYAHKITIWASPVGQALSESERREAIARISKTLVADGTPVDILCEDPAPVAPLITGRDVLQYRKDHGISQ